jgi:hypothetical protein
MNRSYLNDATRAFNGIDLAQRTAYHEAGHAAAIHIRNRQKHLPPVFFQIVITQPAMTGGWASFDEFSAVVEGGYLLHSLPHGLIESAAYFAQDIQDAYRTAIDADLINLLVGPLAEAKYVALCDGECFDAQQITIESLHRYGGAADLEKVNEYLSAFMAGKAQRQEKIVGLLEQAYRFVSADEHWDAVERLAAYILSCRENVIGCEEALAVLDNNYSRAGKLRLTACFYARS